MWDRTADRPRQGSREGPRGKFLREAQEKTILPKKLKAAEPANSPVKPGEGGVPIYNVHSGGGADLLLATNMRTTPVHAGRRVAHWQFVDHLDPSVVLSYLILQESPTLILLACASWFRQCLPSTLRLRHSNSRFSLAFERLSWHDL